MHFYAETFTFLWSLDSSAVLFPLMGIEIGMEIIDFH